jgi:hypothetical protein
MSKKNKVFLIAAVVGASCLLGAALLVGSGYHRTGMTTAVAAMAAFEAARRNSSQRTQAKVLDAQEEGRKTAAKILRERKAQLEAERNVKASIEDMTLEEKVALANKAASDKKEGQ